MAIVSAEPTKFCRPVTSTINVAGRQVCGLCPGAPLARGGDRIPVHPHAGPAAGDRVLADDRIYLWEWTIGIEVGVGVLERTRRRVGEVGTGLLVGEDLVPTPGVEQCVRCLQEALGTLVALVLGDIPAPSKILPREGTPRRHHVPRGAAFGEVVQRRELPDHLIGLVERRVDRARQTEVFRDRSQRGQHGEGVRTADHVEVVDLAALFAQPQPLGEEHEVELAALGGLGEVHERAKVDVAARLGIAQRRRMVYAGEVRSEVNLPYWLGHSHVLLRNVSRVAVGGAGEAQRVSKSGPGVSGAEQPSGLKFGHHTVDDLEQVVRDGRRAQPKTRGARGMPLLHQISDFTRVPSNICASQTYSPFATSSSRRSRAAATPGALSSRTTRSARTRTGAHRSGARRWRRRCR